MSTFEIVSAELHRTKRWKPNNGYQFAAQDAMCAISVLEAPHAAFYLPLAFSIVEDHFELFVVQGLENGKNYVVDSSGNWLAGYIPASYRCHPFVLANVDGEQFILCVDTASLSDTEGNIFFDENAEPSEQIKKTMEFLSQISLSRKATLGMCSLLQEMDLLEPWPITFQQGDKSVSLDGFYRVNEGKFNGLSDGDFQPLRKGGLLPLIYLQLFSMQNLPRIAQRAQLLAPSSNAPQELKFEMGKDYGNITFDGI